jgi:hypothetical protein
MCDRIWLQIPITIIIVYYLHFVTTRTKKLPSFALKFHIVIFCSSCVLNVLFPWKQCVWLSRCHRRSITNNNGDIIRVRLIHNGVSCYYCRFFRNGSRKEQQRLLFLFPLSRFVIKHFYYYLFYFFLNLSVFLSVQLNFTPEELYFCNNLRTPPFYKSDGEKNYLWNVFFFFIIIIITSYYQCMKYISIISSMITFNVMFNMCFS